MTDEPTAVNVADHDVVLRIRHTRSIAEARVLYAERIAQAREQGIRQAVEWLQADYEYGTGPDWRERGCEWIEQQAAKERIAGAATTADAPTTCAPAGYFVAPDASHDLWVWRERGDYPVPVLGRRELRDDPELWDAIVAVIEPTP